MQVENQQQKAERVKQQVIAALGITEEQYGENQLRIGRQYLQSYIARDPDGIDALLEDETFWKWWKNQWMLRDIQFLQAAHLECRHRHYATIHSVDGLIKQIYPNAVVLQEAYGRMIAEVIDNCKNEMQ